MRNKFIEISIHEIGEEIVNKLVERSCWSRCRSPFSFRADRVDAKGGEKRDLEASRRGGEGGCTNTGPVAIVAKTVGIPRAITHPTPWSLSSLPLLGDVRSYFDPPSLPSVSFTRNEAPLVDGGKARGWSTHASNEPAPGGWNRCINRI